MRSKPSKRRTQRRSQRRSQPKRQSSSKRRSRVRISIEPPILSTFGYFLTEPSAEKRRRALRRALQHKPSKSPLSLFRRLNVLYIYNKHKHPTYAARAWSDRNYIRTLW